MFRTIVFFVCIFMLTFIAARYYFNDKLRTNIKDYNALLESGLIEKGWLPDFLPKSIREISEEHDLDSNIVMAKFSIDKNDTGNFDKACRKLNDTDGNRIYECDYQNSEVVIKIAPDGSGSLVSGLRESHNKSVNSQP